jgi:hypothetical protein
VVILLGTFCTPAILAKCLEVSTLDLAGALQELEEASLVGANETMIAAPHALIADACVESAPVSKMLALHARIAEVLEHHASGPGTVKLLWEAAEHWLSSGSGDRAYSALDRCAESAIRIGRPAEASAILARAADLTTTAELRIGALQRAASLSAEVTESARTVELVARIRSEGGAISPALAVEELRAVVHLDVQTATVPARLEEIVAKSESPEVAAQAALLLVKTADRLRDVSLAERALAIRAMAEPIATELRLEFDLVYQTAFGRLEKAAQVAQQVVRQSDGMPPGPGRWGRRHNAAQVLIAAGYADDAIPLFEECYFTGLRSGLARQPLTSAFQLHAAARDEMRAEAATMWSSRIRALMREPASVSGGFQFVFEGCEALLDGDVTRLCTVAAEMLEHATGSSVHSILVWADSFQVAADHLAAKPANPASIERLASTRNELRGFGADDLTVQVLAEDLIQHAQLADASAFVVEYLQQQRKTKNAIWLGLRRTIETFQLARIEGIRSVTVAPVLST